MFDHDPSIASSMLAEHERAHDFEEGYNAGWSAAREIAVGLIAGKEAQIAGLQNEIAALRGVT